MKISDLLKQINIGGFKIHPSDLLNLHVKNYHSKDNKTLDQEITFENVLKEQK